MDESGSGGVFFVQMILLALMLAVIPATIAAKKERAFLPWYLLGVVLWIVATPKAILLRPRRACPHCAEGIKTNAQACPHCTRELIEPAGRRPKGASLSLSGI